MNQCPNDPTHRLVILSGGTVPWCDQCKLTATDTPQAPASFAVGDSVRVIHTATATNGARVHKSLPMTVDAVAAEGAVCARWRLTNAKHDESGWFRPEDLERVPPESPEPASRLVLNGYPVTIGQLRRAEALIHSACELAAHDGIEFEIRVPVGPTEFVIRGRGVPSGDES